MTDDRKGALSPFSTRISTATLRDHEETLASHEGRHGGAEDASGDLEY
jgi:hypothetical protein